MRAPTITLVALPWHALSMPSIQLGTLCAVLGQAGIATEVRSLMLAFMEHCVAETEGRPEGERITVADYATVAEDYASRGLGDWIFAIPSFRDDAVRDAQYVAYLRDLGVPETVLGKALVMRTLVPAFLDRCVEEILASRPRIVGFTTTFSQNVPSLVVAKRLRERDPAVAIVFGGGNCDGPMGAALHRAFPWIDVVVRGEAERVLPDLVRDLFAGGPVRPAPGLCYREGDQQVVVPQQPATPVTMDDVPMPIMDEYFERLEKTSFAAEVASRVSIPFETSRGCWWGAKSHCTFCGLNGTSMAFRSKSPARVVDELAALAHRHQRLDFTSVDTILDLEYLREVMPRLREAGQDFRMYYEVKSNLRREQVRLLRDAGVKFLQPGIESLSTPILRLMRKGVTAFQNVRLLKWCAEDGIEVVWNILYGFPREPEEEYMRMARVIPSLAHLWPPMLNLLALHRFSPYHQRPAEFGLENLGPVPWYRLIYPTDEATLTDLAYSFDYRHLDGHTPTAYIGPLRAAVDAWRSGHGVAYRALRYRRGPGFLVVHDRRPGLTADYSFDEQEAQLYLACADGATAAEACAALGAAGSSGVDVDDVRTFLDDLVSSRLVYEEAGRYLALALPATLPEMP